MREISRRVVRGLLTMTALALASGLATASVVSGTFTSDDQLQSFNLYVGSPGTVGITSFGYGGGTTASGPVAAGGFDTMLFLFNAAGALVGQSDDGLFALVDPSTGIAADAGLSSSFAAGFYTLVLTQFDNFVNGFTLSDGFSRSGQGNFTPGLSGTCAATSFCDWDGNARTANWTLEITGAVIPEPASIALVAIAGLAAGAVRRRRPLAATAA